MVTRAGTLAKYAYVVMSVAGKVDGMVIQSPVCIFLSKDEAKAYCAMYDDEDGLGYTYCTRPLLGEESTRW